MADNEWYEKHKKDVTAAVKRGRGAAPDAGVPCTLVKMKDGSALLCAGVTSSKATALVKEAKAAGGKILSRGTLYKGDNGPTFAVSDGSTSVKALFASAAMEAMGTPLKVDIIAVTPPTDGEAPPTDTTVPPPTDSTVRPPPPPPPPSPPPEAGAKARFTDLLKQVRPRFQQVVAADPPNKANLEKGMGLVISAARENDFARGLKVLQALDGALKKTPTANAPPPPPPPPPQGTAVPPPPPPSPPPATAAIRAALTKMIPLVKNAAASHPDRKMELLDPLKRCQDHLKDGQTVEAKAALFDLNRVLKGLNGTAPPPPPPPPPPTGKVPMEEEAESKEEDREDDDTKAGVTAPENKEEAEETDEEEKEEAEETDEEQKEEAEETDEEQKEEADTTLTTESKEEVGETDEEEEEEFDTPDAEDEEKETTTVGVWVKARDKVIAQVRQLQAALGKESQETGDPDFDLIADKGLAAITKRLQVGLHVALLEFDHASGDAKAKARAKAQKVVSEFQTFLGSDRMVRLVDENPFGVKLEIRSVLGGALGQLGKTLGA